MADVFAVAEMLVAHARRFYGDEVGIVVYYGSHARGTASPTSDLDLYFVPDSRRAYPLGTQFVLDGLPYDFWPVSWTMIEEIAQGRGERPFSV
ncbi:MAG: nucleotidyltransferase domain-containing protein, partial [Anaerolineales bacterium]|nr:nucleotidyltransferase domain-containing protein [Anaerolineales bacterium]